MFASTFTGNTASSGGGAIYNLEMPGVASRVNTSTFTQNQAFGGGSSVAEGTLRRRSSRTGPMLNRRGSGTTVSAPRRGSGVRLSSAESSELRNRCGGLFLRSSLDLRNHDARWHQQPHTWRMAPRRAHLVRHNAGTPAGWLIDPPPEVIATPPVYVAFDCLAVNGRDLRARPLRERRRVLEDLVCGSDVFPVRRLADDGLEAWAEVQRRGLEGMVAKDDGSRYVGGPTRSWLKVKVRQEGQFHVGAIRFEGGEFAGLLVGRRVGRRLRFLGTVELGFGRAAVEDLLTRSHTLRRSTSPFGHRGAGRRVAWLEPELVAEVSYTGVLHDRLREPVFRALAQNR